MKNTGNAAYLALILLIAFTLRAVGLEDTPAWYWDEGYYLELVKNIAAGDFQAFGLRWLGPHPPLYWILSALIVPNASNPFMALRVLAVLLASATTILVFLLGRELFSDRVGLTAALVYALFPSGVYWGRVALHNNLFNIISLAAVLTLLYYIKSGRKRDLILLTLLSAAAFYTQYTEAALLLSTAFILLDGKKRRELVLFAAVFASSLLLYLAASFLVFRDLLLYTIRDQMQRFNILPAILLLALASLLPAASRRLKRGFSFRLFQNRPNAYIILFYVLSSLTVLSQPMSDSKFSTGADYMLFIGAMGLLFLPDSQGSKRLVTLALPLYVFLSVLRRTDHTLTPLIPYLSVSTALFMQGMFETLSARMPRKKTAALLLAGIVIPLLLVGDFQTFFLHKGIRREDAASNQALKEYLTCAVSPKDTVLAPAQVAHMLPGHATTVAEASAYAGGPLMYSHGKIPKHFYVRNLSLSQVTAAVTADKTPSWMLDEGFGPLIAGFEKWPSKPVGSYIVYINPKQQVLKADCT